MNTTTTTTTTTSAANSNDRNNLRSALRTHLRALHGRRHGVEVSSMTIDELKTEIARAGYDVTAAAETAQLVRVGQAPTAAPQVEARAPEQAQAELREAAPASKTQAEALDADETFKTLLASFATGTTDSFRARVAELVERANKPPVEIVKEIVRERVVHAQAAPDGCAPAHTPVRVNTKTARELFEVSASPLAEMPISVWDAPDAPEIDQRYVWPAQTGAALAQMRRGRNIMLVGPAGTGKSSFAEQIAARTQRPFVTIPCTEQTDAAQLVGLTVPKAGGGTRWQDGILAKAIRRSGTIILIDEPSVARPGAMFAFQSVLADTRALWIEETGERIRVAEGVTFILADNTGGLGDQSGQYDGTRRLNRATLDRVGAVLEIGYLPPAAEEAVIMARTGCKKALAHVLVNFANLTRRDTTTGRLTHGVGLRRLLSWAELIADGVAPDEAFNLAVLAISAHDDREVLRQIYTINAGERVMRAAQAA